jgi:hypothetical protein
MNIENEDIEKYAPIVPSPTHCVTLFFRQTTFDGTKITNRERMVSNFVSAANGYEAFGKFYEEQSKNFTGFDLAFKTCVSIPDTQTKQL